MDFSAFNVWTALLLVAILLFSLFVASMLKRFIPFLRKSLIPNSVLGGIILLIVSTIFYYTMGDYLFNLILPGEALASLEFAGPAFDALKSVAGTNTQQVTYNGMKILEIITYHCLGIGFIAMSMRGNKRKLTKKRTGEIFNSGVITVNGYLVQAIIGIVVTIVAVRALHVAGLIDASGILLCFGFGQGTGQALNFGTIYEENGMAGGGNFGLTIAAMGFLVACIVGVIYLVILKRKGAIKIDNRELKPTLKDYEDEGEMLHVDSMDKFTVQAALVLGIYGVSFLIMWGLSKALPGMTSTFFGFNFLIGVILTIPVKAVINALEKKKIIRKKIVNNFMMTRIGGIAFDLMIVAGIGAIELPLLKDHWGVILILSVLGGAGTFFYVYYTSKKLFPKYRHEQFLCMFGMLTGTASTGMILLREIDGTYKTPAGDNVVYQSVPAIAFGFPMMLLAKWAAKGMKECLIVLAICIAYFGVLNLILFRSKIFKRKGKAALSAESEEGTSEAGEGSEEGASEESDESGPGEESPEENAESGSEEA